MKSEKMKSILQPAPHQVNNQLVIKMVEEAERSIQHGLNKKRERLKIQMANEAYTYQQEIMDKYMMLREQARRAEIDELERLKIERELDRKKFIELKQMQQHLSGSEPLRLQMSKKLIEECKQSRDDQIKFSKHQQQSQIEAEKAEIQEARRYLMEETQRKAEADRILKHQQINEANEELKRQMMIKREQRKLKEAEEEIERKLQQHAIETTKKLDMESQSNKQKEIQQQKEFLRRQIEERKMMEEYKRKKELEYEQAMAKAARDAMQKETDAIEQAKRMQHMENSKYLHYLNKVRSDEREMSRNHFEPKCASLINEEFEEVETKCQAKKQQLNHIMKSEYLRQMAEREREKALNKQRECLELEEAQRQNAEYERMMAQRRQQNRLQFVRAIEQQKEFKGIEKAYQLEKDARLRDQLDEIEQESESLTKKLLEEGLDRILPKHPFYQCLKHHNN